MKKQMLVFFSLILVILTVSCSASKPVAGPITNYVEAAKLTDREKQLISVGNNGYYVFDYQADDQFNSLEVWIDSYRFGEKVSSDGKLGSGFFQNKSGLIAVTLKEQENKKYSWTIANIQNGSIMSTSPVLGGINIDGQNTAVATQTIAEPASIENKKEITLGSICYVNQSNNIGIRSLSNEFYHSPDTYLDEIKAYDLVYLIKVKFSEEQLK